MKPISCLAAIVLSLTFALGGCATTQDANARAEAGRMRAEAIQSRAEFMEKKGLFTEALRLHDDGRWSAAYEVFAGLADRGHGDGARLALMMHLHGAQVYRAEWPATTAQVENWRAAAAGSRGFEIVVSVRGHASMVLGPQGELEGTRFAGARATNQGGAVASLGPAATAR